MNHNLTETIKEMSYTQFVAFVNQWNVPPGSLSTVNEWSIFGHVKKESRILEVACTTGFSGRELARITGCSVTGVDICAASIDAAKQDSSIYGEDLNLQYIHTDACNYNSPHNFSHIVLGASLGFFDNPTQMLGRLKNFFGDLGYVLASPYYGTGNIPQDLISECQRVIGITPTSTHYDSIRSIYQNFEVAYESRKTIVLETPDQMRKYTEDTVQNCCRIKNITSDAVYQVLFDRLYEIKHISNELHKYQAYSVLVLRYLRKVYPNRFTELF